MFVWGFDNYLATAVLVLSGLCIFYSLRIALMSKGAPRGWYLFILAFVVFFVYRAFQLLFDTLSTKDLIDDWEVALSLAASLLVLAGLVTLERSFRRQMRLMRYS